MRKSFKVATVFTGAAACAAAFTPAAEAATTAKIQQMEPATSHRNCAVGPATTSMVFTWPASKHHGPTCVGGANYRGKATHLGTNYIKMCTGNNSGSVQISGHWTSFVRSEFVSWSRPAPIGSVLIGSWTGTYKCAT